MSAIRGHHGLLLLPVDAQTDPDFADVKALLNMGGPAGGASFQDSTGSRVWTPSGSVAVSRALGPNTALFAGGNIATPYEFDDFDWWVEDYTLEAWIYATSFTGWYSTTVPVMVGNANPGTPTNYWSFGPGPGGALSFYYYNGTGVVETGDTVPTGELAHIAMCHSGGDLFLAVNGAVSSPIPVSGTPQSGNASGAVLTLGKINNTAIDGHVQALRVTKGAARYTSNFTPPPAPFPTA